MENTPRVIKSITPVKCPNCNTDINICIQQGPAIVGWVLKQKEILKAKEEARGRLDLIKFKSEEDKKMIYKWLDDPNTIFGPEDVGPYIQEVLRSQKNEEGNKD